MIKFNKLRSLVFKSPYNVQAECLKSIDFRYKMAKFLYEYKLYSILDIELAFNPTVYYMIINTLQKYDKDNDTRPPIIEPRDRNYEFEKRVMDYLNILVEPFFKLTRDQSDQLFDEFYKEMDNDKTNSILKDNQKLQTSASMEDALFCSLTGFHQANYSNLEYFVQDAYIFGDAISYISLECLIPEQSLRILDKLVEDQNVNEVLEENLSKNLNVKQFFLEKVVGYKSINDAVFDKPILPIRAYKRKLKVSSLKSILNEKGINQQFKELCLKQYPNLYNQQDTEEVNMYDIFNKFYNKNLDFSTDDLCKELFEAISLLEYAKDNAELESYINNKFDNIYIKNISSFLISSRINDIDISVSIELYSSIINILYKVSDQTKHKLIEGFDILNKKGKYLDNCKSKDVRDFIFNNYTEQLENCQNKPIWYNTCVIDNIKNIKEFDIKLIKKLMPAIESRYYQIKQLYDSQLEFLQINKYKSKIRQILSTLKSIHKDVEINISTEEDILNSCYKVNDFLSTNPKENKALKDFKEFVTKHKLLLDRDKYQTIINEYLILKDKIFTYDYADEIQKIKQKEERKFIKKLKQIQQEDEYDFDTYYNKFLTKLDDVKFDIDGYSISNQQARIVFEDIMASYNPEDVKTYFATHEYENRKKIRNTGRDLTKHVFYIFKGLENFLCSFIRYAYNNKYLSLNRVKKINIDNRDFDSCYLIDLIDEIQKGFLKVKFDGKVDDLNDKMNHIPEYRNPKFHKERFSLLSQIDDYIKDTLYVIKGLVTTIAKLKNKQ